MIRSHKTLPVAATVADLLALFASEKVLMALVTDGDGRLVSAIDREDLTVELAEDLPAHGIGRLTGRVVCDDAPLDCARALLDAQSRRRLAVVDRDGRLVGLLCLKRRRHGFCTDRDVEARA